MIAIDELENGVLIARVTAHLDKSELADVAARIEHALEQNEKTHILAEVIGFEGFDLSALPDYLPRALAMLGKRDRFGRIAVIADQTWVRAATRLESALIPGLRYEVFTPQERDQALAWIKGEHVLPHSPALTIIESDRPGVFGYQLDGRLTAPEVELVADHFAQLLEQPGQLRVLGRIRDLAGMEPSAMVSGKYLSMKLKALSRVERYALVGGPAWLHTWVSAIAPFVKTEMRCFDASEELAAWDWLEAHPKGERALAA